MRKQLQTLFILLSFTLLSCKKEEIKPQPIYFMYAKMNSMDWQANNVSSQQEYDYNASTFQSLIKAGGEASLTEGIKYDLSFVINKEISKGKFFFNNDGQEWGMSNGGVVGYIRIHKPSLLPSHSYPYFDAHSTTGFIEITHLTKYEIGGTFEFTAMPSKYSGYPASNIYKVESGKFLVPINMISDANWKGPK